MGSESLPVDIRYPQAIRKPIFTEPVELYNLRDDIGETTDLSKSHATKTQELFTRLQAWQKATNAAIPTQPNPAFDADAERTAIEQALAKKSKR